MRIKEVVQTGETVDEAINAACLRLGAKLEDCEFDIIDLPRTSFFGLRKVPAKVRVWRELTDEEKRAEEQKAQAERELAAKNAAAQKAAQKKAAEQKAQQEKKAAKSPKKEAPTPAKASTKPPKVVEKPAPAPEKKATPPQGEMDLPEHIRNSTTLSETDKAKVVAAREYVHLIMDGMNIEGETEIREEEGTVTIAVSGRSLGTIIGRRGQTLNSVQYLTGLIANRLEGDYQRILVDAGDYRLKQTRKLEETARKAAKEVLRTDVSRSLDTMNPSERRIVHSEVAEIDGVSSYSIGRDPYRRVVIKTPTSKLPPRDRGGRRSRGRQSEHSDSRPRRESRLRREREPEKQAPRPEKKETTAPKEPIITPETKAETPLFGKVEFNDIDLD